MARNSAATKQVDSKPARAAKTSPKTPNTVEAKIDKLTDAVTSLVDVVSRNAKDVPAVITKTFEAPEQNLGKAAPAQFTEAAGTGENDANLIIPHPEVMDDGERLREKYANNAFMNEMVTVHIHDTAEKNADPSFSIAVNGVDEFFIRGQKKTVKRMFVEGLARAKPVSFKNEEYTRQDGVRDVRWPSNRGLRYSFAVVHDPNPRGASWLASVLAQP